MSPLPDIYLEVESEIRAWNPVSGPSTWSNPRFDEWARAIFEHQYDSIPPYRDFCRRRAIEPDAIADYRAIPAVSTEVFKHVDLYDGGAIERTFRTSGTTGEARGRHHFRTLELYRASLHGPFRRFCNPEGESLRMLVLTQSPEDAPESSLAFMIGELVERWGDAGSDFFVDPSGGEEGALDLEALVEALDRAAAGETPTMLLGTAFAFAELVERTETSWSLPEGSRLMETGGFKGRHRNVTREELYEAFESRLDLRPGRCVGEYSMTELSTQAYTPTLVESTDGLPTPRFRTPPWARLEIVDMETLEPLDTSGERGLIRWYDLANVGSVLAVQTFDLGVRTPEGDVILEGRAPKADLRGCSLTIEELERR